MSENFHIRKVAVLGAGVMGAQIAAHLVNANVRDAAVRVARERGRPERQREQGAGRPEEARPQPARQPVANHLHRAANYEQHLEQLRDCDLVIEAIAERMDWKSDLYRKVAPFVNERAIFASNTSGLSINELAEAFPDNLRHRFCGIHFFNPPRYMHLVELIPCTRDRGEPARPAGDLPRLHAGQGRGARQGHAQLHRQPHRRVLHARHQASRGGVQSRLRHGGCADRALSRPPQERHLPHAGRGRPRRVRACGQHHAREPHRRPVAQALRVAGLVQLPGRSGLAGAEDQDAASTRRSARRSTCSTCTPRPTACPTPRWTTA